MTWVLEQGKFSSCVQWPLGPGGRPKVTLVLEREEYSRCIRPWDPRFSQVDSTFQLWTLTHSRLLTYWVRQYFLTYLHCTYTVISFLGLGIRPSSARPSYIYVRKEKDEMDKRTHQ